MRTDSMVGQATTKRKRRSVSAVRDFQLVPGRYNPYLSAKRKWEMHTHLTQIADEYAKMEDEEIQLLKEGALAVRSE